MEKGYICIVRSTNLKADFIEATDNITDIVDKFRMLFGGTISVSIYKSDNIILDLAKICYLCRDFCTGDLMFDMHSENVTLDDVCVGVIGPKTTHLYGDPVKYTFEDPDLIPPV
jgi:hypothetical protein